MELDYFSSNLSVSIYMYVGQPVDLCCVCEPAIVAGLLKMYFRNRPDSIIPRGKTTISLSAAARDKDIEGTKAIISRLPEEHYMILQMTVELLRRVR